jgi:hypothetical protein
MTAIRHELLFFRTAREKGIPYRKVRQSAFARCVKGQPWRQTSSWA